MNNPSTSPAAEPGMIEPHIVKTETATLKPLFQPPRIPSPANLTSFQSSISTLPNGSPVPARSESGQQSISTHESEEEEDDDDEEEEEEEEEDVIPVLPSLTSRNRAIEGSIPSAPVARVLTKLIQNPYICEFLLPVIENHPGIAPQYLDRIRQPMDMRTIFLEARSGHYATPEGLEKCRKRVQRVFANAEAYNQGDPTMCNVARHLRSYFEVLWLAFVDTRTPNHGVKRRKLLEERANSVQEEPLGVDELSYCLRLLEDLRSFCGNDEQARNKLQALASKLERCSEVIEAIGETEQAPSDPLEQAETSEEAGPSQGTTGADSIPMPPPPSRPPANGSGESKQQHSVSREKTCSLAEFSTTLLEVLSGLSEELRQTLEIRSFAYMVELELDMSEKLARGSPNSSCWACAAELGWSQAVSSRQSSWWPVIVLYTGNSKSFIQKVNQSRVPQGCMQTLLRSRRPNQEVALVEFLGTHEFAWVPMGQVKSYTGPNSSPEFVAGRAKSKTSRRGKFGEALVEAEEIYQAGVVRVNGAYSGLLCASSSLPLAQFDESWLEMKAPPVDEAPCAEVVDADGEILLSSILAIAVPQLPVPSTPDAKRTGGQGAPSSGHTRRVEGFPSCLLKMLTEGSDQIVSWSEDGTKILFKDVSRLEAELLQKYFKRTKKFSTMRSQLGAYYFVREKPDETLGATIVYSHPLFQRDKADSVNALLAQPIQVPKASAEKRTPGSNGRKRPKEQKKKSSARKSRCLGMVDTYLAKLRAKEGLPPLTTPDDFSGEEEGCENIFQKSKNGKRAWLPHSLETSQNIHSLRVSVESTSSMSRKNALRDLAMSLRADIESLKTRVNLPVEPIVDSKPPPIPVNVDFQPAADDSMSLASVVPSSDMLFMPAPQLGDAALLTPSANKPPRKRAKGGASKYRGVFLSPSKKWMGRITVNGKRTSLGAFETEEDAARAYDQAAVEHFGPKAKCNFDENGDFIPSAASRKTRKPAPAPRNLPMPSSTVVPGLHPFTALNPPSMMGVEPSPMMDDDADTTGAMDVDATGHAAGAGEDTSTSLVEGALSVPNLGLGEPLTPQTGEYTRATL